MVQHLTALRLNYTLCLMSGPDVLGPRLVNLTAIFGIVLGISQFVFTEVAGNGFQVNTCFNIQVTNPSILPEVNLDSKSNMK